MTDNYYPFLMLRKLVILNHQGAVLYDESFHEGLNIIRGKNSTGKSTISNFIFYVLGGDFFNWNSDALRCREVLAEIEINNAVLTLSRLVEKDKKQRPLSIFWGNYFEATKTRAEGWNTFPYRQTDNQKSFSSVIFDLLGFPEVRSDDDNKITIHQVLRLLYIDQDSPTQNLFRFERFDLPLTRLSISELLLGVYDDSLYEDRLLLKAVTKNYDEKSSQLKNILRAFRLTETKVNLNEIETRVAKLGEEVGIINIKLEEIRNINSIKTRSNTPLQIEKLQVELKIIKDQFRLKNIDVNRLNNDIVDSEYFIEALENKLKAIEESIVTSNNLEELSLKFCPQCLSPLDIPGDDNHEICNLCKNVLEGGANAKAQQIRQEIELQIRESKKLLQKKRERKADLDRALRSTVELGRLKQKEYNNAVESTMPTRDEKLEELLILKGGKEREIEYLIQQRKYADLINDLKSDIEELEKEIKDIRLRINTKELNQQKRLDIALRELQEFTKNILKKDLNRQEEFNDPRSVEIDFYHDVFRLDEKFNFSASSNVVLKNAVRFSILFSSLEKKFFRYPRFILCDNIEDKGMEEIRSQNFQKIIYKLSTNSSVRHQIIMTTSMVDEELNQNDSITVGDFYTENNKSLK
ncbi:MAG: hypothetical protein MI974_31780 [Chitinophagales bacterium]|nr:hypothetical protein [Chitinophagales bacterium]